MTSEIGTEYKTLNQLAAEAHQNSVDHGFYDDNDGSVSYEGNKFALFHSEVSEGYEELRAGHEASEVYYNEDKPTKPEGVAAELADVLIRIFDYAGWKGIDLDAIVEEKMKYNASRIYKHGKQF